MDERKQLIPERSFYRDIMISDIETDDNEDIA